MSFCKILLQAYHNISDLENKGDDMAAMIKKAETIFERFERTLEMLAEKIL